MPLRAGPAAAAGTVAAVIALALGIGNLIAFAAALTINGKTPGLVSILIPSAITLVAGIGMWKAKYWAVLGFEALLGILIRYLALFLVRASNLLGCIVPIAIIVPSGFLFWKLVRVRWPASRCPTTRRAARRHELVLHPHRPRALRRPRPDGARQQRRLPALLRVGPIAFHRSIVPDHDVSRPPSGFGVVVAELHANYRAPAYYDEDLRTAVRPADLARFIVQARVRDAGRRAAAGRGPRRARRLQLRRNESVPLPDDLRTRLERAMQAKPPPGGGAWA